MNFRGCFNHSKFEEGGKTGYEVGKNIFLLQNIIYLDSRVFNSGD
jgi:hypothetical protein